MPRTAGTPPMTGPAERGLDRTGWFYAAVIRTAVVAVSSLAALITAQPRQLLLATVVVLGFNAWNLCFAVALVRGRRRWLLPTETLGHCVR